MLMINQTSNVTFQIFGELWCTKPTAISLSPCDNHICELILIKRWMKYKINGSTLRRADYFTYEILTIERMQIQCEYKNNIWKKTSVRFKSLNSTLF